MTREEVSLICKAMSDPNRLKIIEMLTKGEKCGCELLDELQVTQPTLSHHMKVLSDCGLVSSYKEGKWQHYSINCQRFAEFKEYLNGVTCWKDDAKRQSCCCGK
ncbi:MAG: metalloregulator ArsR/SmtB family transcription factor [Oscillospiraceae bacterium]|nr:metalloregulator ArsR/SmtB family transcription factor [Oscillospiraceae bacterium]